MNSVGLKTVLAAVAVHTVHTAAYKHTEELNNKDSVHVQILTSHWAVVTVPLSEGNTDVVFVVKGDIQTKLTRILSEWSVAVIIPPLCTGLDLFLTF